MLGSLVIMAISWGAINPFVPAPWGQRIALGATIVVAVIALVDVMLNWRQMKFFYIDLGNKTCLLYRGRFLTTRSVIVSGSVLSVDVVRGPLLRKLELARVKLNGIANFPEIPALDESDACLLQRCLTADSKDFL